MKRIEGTSTLPGVHLFEIPKFSDNRGWLMELFRNDEIDLSPEMVYVSQTSPYVVRGPHEHVNQSDFFAFIGPGEFHLHLWGEPFLHTDGDEGRLHEIHRVGESNPCAVIVPPGIVHAYKNVSDVPGLVFNAPDALYAGPGKQYPVDEIRHEDSMEFMEKYAPELLS